MGWRTIASSVSCLFLAACGYDAGAVGASPDAGAGTPECFSSSECPVGWQCSELGICVPPPQGADADPGTPAEVEYKLTEPHASRRYVWVAMTDLDRLAKIDGMDLAVTSIPVGDRPEVLATMPGTDTAVVLDTVNGSATVVRPTQTADLIEVYPTLPHMNQITTTMGGRYAVTFFDLAKAIEEAGSLEAVTEVGSFQDVTVLALQPGMQRAVDLTVGFRPREVEVDVTGRYAFVVTDDGVSVIDLPAMTQGEPAIVPPIPITTDPFGDPSGIEVDVIASGDYAVVRIPGIAGVRVVDMLPPADGAAWDVVLPREPSDIDLAPDGARVYAAMRNPPGLAILDIPEDAIDPSGVTLIELPSATGGQLVVSADGTTGLLFTNSILDERLTVIELDRAGSPRRTYPLQKSVRAVGFDPTGTKAIVLHARAPGDPDDATTFEQYIDRMPGYSVFDVATGFAKLQITDVDPSEFTFATTAPRAYVTLDGGDAEGALAAVQLIELDSGVVRTIELGSPPDAIGLLPDASKIYVSQRHPLGRVSFIDVATAQVRTLTGFDLNSQVID